MAKRRKAKVPKAATRRATASRPVTGPSSSSRGATSSLIVISDRGGKIADLPVNNALAGLAEEWTYILQSRRRWAGSRETRRQQAALAEQSLLGLNLAASALDRIAEAPHVEVSIPAIEDNRHDAARRVPWEYLLSASTAARRAGKKLLITRHLDVRPPVKMREPKSLLFIESAPGRLQREYVFDSERKSVSSGLNIPETRTIVSKNETIAELTKKFAAGPDVVHFAGFDVNQGARVETSLRNSDRQGLLFASSDDRPRVVAGKEFAAAMRGGTRRPALVCFNCYFSGADLAAAAVRAGAAAAIGFADEIDDEIAESFFGALYREWRFDRWNIISAFTNVWSSLRVSAAQFHGTGIVLWKSESVFAARDSRSVASVARAAAPPAPTAAPAHETFRVEAKPLREINYSLLHNDQPIFSQFKTKRLKDGPPVRLKVEVLLIVGVESYPFRSTVIFENNKSEVVTPVKIPLISTLARSLRERIQSTLYWCVTVNKDEVISENTVPVTLLPVDEWSDDVEPPNAESPVERRSVWLPSFVLPRDPAVAHVIDLAQRYLMALQDDPAAGFDGYQQVDPDDPNSRAAVDLQVRAIWSAISYDLKLSYINPPPSYSRITQRLRTPSDVVNGKRGTCIDLALLLAACLEYIDIYPTLILLTGHAFPAYWRSETPHQRFMLADRSLLAGTRATNVSATSAGSRELTGSSESRGWVFSKEDGRAFDELLRYIQRGDLVPLETVSLTDYSSFEDARATGLENLRNPREFDSMLDIVRARRALRPVTPLPIIQV